MRGEKEEVTNRYYMEKRKRMRLGLAVWLLAAVVPCKAQTVIGTNGLMNVPTADMRPAGTFDGGASFIQKELLYKKTYNTYL